MLIVLCSLLIGCSNNSKIGSIEIIQQSDNKTWALTEKDTVTKFMNALNNKTETNEKIDIRPRDYYVKILYKDKSSEEYSLWLDKEDISVRGILMKGNQTWYINKDSNSIFKGMLQ